MALIPDLELQIPLDVLALGKYERGEYGTSAFKLKVDGSYFMRIYAYSGCSKNRVSAGI